MQTYEKKIVLVALCSSLFAMWCFIYQKVTGTDMRLPHRMSALVAYCGSSIIDKEQKKQGLPKNHFFKIYEFMFWLSTALDVLSLVKEMAQSTNKDN